MAIDDVDKLIMAAHENGKRDGTERELGDLREMLIICWVLLTEQDRKAALHLCTRRMSQKFAGGPNCHAWRAARWRQRKRTMKTKLDETAVPFIIERLLQQLHEADHPLALPLRKILCFSRLLNAAMDLHEAMCMYAGILPEADDVHASILDLLRELEQDILRERQENEANAKSV